ncbi:RNA polymerase sigma factor [Sphingobacterium tabacisoli]|uniref:RNA polymerase sigma factor n=1 Tax=Sphingobacterium tabacisoli TaxID=2044855 RepID=A0ABW5KXZ7_9SPHI|nr:RNA polymerase sigma-70 factor [Sphingobacterium tabacisoli]
MLKPTFNQEFTQLLAAGDEQAFTSLFDFFSPKVNAFALKLTRSENLAQEVVQEVFLRIWKFRSRLLEVEQLEGYLIRTARNVAFDMLKSQAIHFLELEEWEDDKYFVDHSMEEGIHAKEGQHVLEQALAHLTPKQREVYQLCRIEGMSYQQAAEQLDISTHTVHFHMKESLRQLRMVLINSGFPAYLVILLIR